MNIQEILSRLPSLPPQQQGEIMNLLKINQAKELGKQRALDRLDDYVQSKNVSQFLGISGENLK
jgi:hypothetical protein